MNIPIHAQSPRGHITDLGATTTTAVVNETIDLRRILELVSRRLWLVLAVFLLGSVLALVAGFLLMPNYTATALLAVQTPAYKDARADDASAVDTHITLLKSDAFLARVARALAKDTRLDPATISLVNLRRHTNVMQELKSALISINETAKSPAAAAIIANAIATSYVDGLMGEATASQTSNIVAAEQQLANIDARIKQAGARLADPATSEADRAQERPALAALASIREDLLAAAELARRQAADQIRSDVAAPAVRIAARAETPRRPSSINPMLIIVPGAFVSLIAGIAAALALSRLDPRLRRASDVIDYFKTPSFDIPGEKGAAEKAALGLTVALLSTYGDRQKRIVVTSCREKDGKDQLVEDIARSAARLRPSVLIVDLDCVSSEPDGTIYRVVGAPFDKMNCRAILDAESAPDLRLREQIAQASSSYEWIIVNAPPILKAPMVRLLMDCMSFGLLATRSGATIKPYIQDALRMLSPENVTGVPNPEHLRFAVAVTQPRSGAFAADALRAPARRPSAWKEPAVPASLNRFGGVVSPLVPVKAPVGATSGVSATIEKRE